MEFTDRYSALGLPYPNAETVCNGQCEGLGVYPTYADNNIATQAVFVTCEQCEGTGLAKGATT
jgi:hypothetical protein